MKIGSTAYYDSGIEMYRHSQQCNHPYDNLRQQYTEEYKRILTLYTARPVVSRGLLVSRCTPQNKILSSTCE